MSSSGRLVHVEDCLASRWLVGCATYYLLLLPPPLVIYKDCCLVIWRRELAVHDESIITEGRRHQHRCSSGCDVRKKVENAHVVVVVVVVVTVTVGRTYSCHYRSYKRLLVESRVWFLVMEKCWSMMSSTIGLSCQSSCEECARKSRGDHCLHAWLHWHAWSLLDLYCEKSLDNLRNISFIPIDNCKDALSLKRIIKDSDSEYDNDDSLYALLSVDER